VSVPRGTFAQDLGVECSTWNICGREEPGRLSAPPTPCEERTPEVFHVEHLAGCSARNFRICLSSCGDVPRGTSGLAPRKMFHVEQPMGIATRECSTWNIAGAWRGQRPGRPAGEMFHVEHSAPHLRNPHAVDRLIRPANVPRGTSR